MEGREDTEQRPNPDEEVKDEDMEDPTQYSVKKLAPIGEAQGTAPIGADEATTRGTLIEEGLDDKVYMIKSSGTIVDVSKKK